MDNERIYKTIDNPMRVLFFTVDEFAMLAIPFLVGTLVGSLSIMCLGFIFWILFRKLKRGCPRNTMIHWLYWRVPKGAFTSSGVLKRIPASHRREYIL